MPVERVYTAQPPDASGNFGRWQKSAARRYTGGMGMEAVGAYIATLRERRGYTQLALAEALGISERGLRDWEKGRTAPDVGDLRELLGRLKGSWMHIAMLARDGATIADARQYAERQAQGLGLTDEQRAFIESLDPDQLAALVAVAEQMRPR